MTEIELRTVSLPELPALGHRVAGVVDVVDVVVGPAEHLVGAGASPISTSAPSAAGEYIVAGRAV